MYFWKDGTVAWKMFSEKLLKFWCVEKNEVCKEDVAKKGVDIVWN